MKKKPKILKVLKSLNLRLIIIICLTAIIPGIVVCAGVLNSYERRAVAIRQSEIMSQAKIIANQVAASNFLTESTPETDIIGAQLILLTNIYDGRVILVDDTFKIIYDTYDMDEHRTIISEEVIQTFSGQTQTNYDPDNHYIEMTIPIIKPDDKLNTVRGVMLVSVSTDNIILNLIYLRRIAMTILVLITILVVFFAVLAILKSTKPLHQLSDGIAAISGGYGEESLAINDYTETERICQKLNEMLAHMRIVDESRQEFVSNVSHELKTPMTSMKVLAESINSFPDAPIEMYQEFMQDITNEIERENKIITDLLSLVKMDKSAADLNITTVKVNELIEQILKRLQPIADSQKVELVLESFRPVVAELDEVKITLAITNLVENGIKYNKNDGTGWVHVSLNADYQYFYIKIEDSGIGIPQDSLDHIYERFYRVDKSHSREIGGTGLGLAITRSSILMHRGAIKVYSELGEGTTFDVRIPLKYIRNE